MDAEGGSLGSGRDVQARNKAALAAVRVRRDAFYEAILSLEAALAVPVGGSPAAWASALAGPTERLRAMLGEHVHGTEEPGGFFDDVVQDAPGLAHSVARLRQEHENLFAGVDALNRALAGTRDDAGVERVRETALDLIRSLLSHRQRGADLVYNAYNVEVATGD